LSRARLPVPPLRLGNHTRPAQDSPTWPAVPGVCSSATPWCARSSPPRSRRRIDLRLSGPVLADRRPRRHGRMNSSCPERSTHAASRSCAATRGTVSVIRTQMERVFANLIGNAIKHMGDQPSPVIGLGAAPRGDVVEYSVKDNGSSIESARHQGATFRSRGRKVPGRTPHSRPDRHPIPTFDGKSFSGLEAVRPACSIQSDGSSRRGTEREGTML
jgi:histidine kinase/DNA gyrase B/HSP90-like ATPase